jgi:hypothetical protein
LPSSARYYSRYLKSFGVVSLYLDDCIEDDRLARQLRAAGHLIYLPRELGVEGQDDDLHLVAATERRAVLATHNQDDFDRIHYKWSGEGREHAGILLVRQRDYIGMKIAQLDRAARLLSPEAARNHLMPYQMFDTEDRALAYVAALTPVS